MQHSFSATFITSINAISSDHWNAICGIDYPFLRHEFFNALENSGSTTSKMGWQAHHLIIKDQDNIIAIMPLFIKTHSYGEYMFDWSWAEAYHRQGLDYYPKLLNAIPFTPASGPRWGIAKDVDQKNVLAFISESIQQECQQNNFSSFHCLFPQQESSDLFTQNNLLQRNGYQYHWFNNSYQNFDDFLATMASRKRKNIKKERLKIEQQNIHLRRKTGIDISLKDWQEFFHFYQLTYIKRSGQTGYLTQEFFPLLAKLMSEHIVMVQAFAGDVEQDNLVAAALCFKDNDTLYGRYWGCKESFDNLHFEACYYQGIEFSIEHGLSRFDPGAQGEHKIQRGFKPIKTYSNHWLNHQDFHHAVGRFLKEEKQHIEQHITHASELLPFKKETN